MPIDTRSLLDFLRGRWGRRIALILVTLGVLILALWWATRPKPVAVLVATAEPGRVESTVANTRAGSVAACRRARLAPPNGGRIERLDVHKGDRVAQGQVLLTLWNEDLAARERVAREQSGTARAHLHEVCQRAAAAASDARRTRELRNSGFVSPQAVERADAESQAQQAACASARTQIREADARIAASRADTARTVLRAPFAGIVAEVNGEVGEFLTPSPPGIPTLPAIDLIDDSCLYVSAPVDEVDAARVRLGMPVRITLDAFRGRHFDGHVRRIAPYVLALEKQARTVEVEAAFEQSPAQAGLLAGYSADVEIVIDARDAAVRIPSGALMPGDRVLVLNGAGRLEARALETGLSNWEYTEVRRGIVRGERVVTSLERGGVEAGARAVVEARTP